MNHMSKKELFLLVVYFAVFAVLCNVFGVASWRASIGVACGGFLIWLLYSELTHLRSLFFIADSELVRVSALANDLEGQVIEMRYKLEELENAHRFHEHEK